MCSRTVSDTANRLLKRTDNEGSPSVVEEKSSAVPLIGAVAGLWSAPSYLIRERQEFKEEGHSFNLRTAQEQCLAAYGQTAGVPSFLPPRRAPHHSAERNFPRFQLTTARKSGIIDTQYRKCDEETSFPSAVLQREDIRCKSLSGAENSHFRAVCN